MAHAPTQLVSTATSVETSLALDSGVSAPVAKAEIPRRSARQHKSQTYLQGYECNSFYPIQKHHSYSNFSPQYSSYVMQVKSVYEPDFYHLAIKWPEWGKDMTEELAALELNKT